MFNNKNLFIALTYRCNAFCKKCMTRYHINKDIEMSKETIDRIFSLTDKNMYEGYISVGTGEPLLYDNFNYFVNGMLNINSKIKLRLLTNGMLLSCDNKKAIFNDRITWGVTMDGMKQETLTFLQKGVDIEKVKSNVSKVAKKYGGDKLYLNFTVTNANINEILSFFKFAVENDIYEIYLTELKIFSGYENDLMKYKVNHDEYFDEKIEEARRYLTNRGISTHGINIDKKTYRCKCYERNLASPMIDVDGSVSFCAGREDVIVGNIMDENIEQKWLDFLGSVKSNDNLWCTKCYDIQRKDGIYNLPHTIKKGK